MLHALTGRLGADCTIKKVIVKENEEKVMNNTLYVWDGRKNSQAIPIHIEAWGNVAEEMEGMTKGTIIQFVGRLKSVGYTPKNSEKTFYQVGYNILKLDLLKNIVHTQNHLLSDFAKVEADDYKDESDPVGEIIFNGDDKVAYTDAELLKRDTVNLMNSGIPVQIKIYRRNGETIPYDFIYDCPNVQAFTIEDITEEADTNHNI